MTGSAARFGRGRDQQEEGSRGSRVHRPGDREASERIGRVGSGSGLGALVVWIVGLGGVVMPAPVGAVIGGGVAGFALLIGRRGIKGLIGVLWQGDQAPAGAGG